MLDVRLITLLPPTQAVTQPSAAPNVTTQGTGVLAQLPAGSILSGFIINRDPNGNPILRTEKGDVLFSSNYFLKIGSEVVLRIQNNAGQQNAHIVTVNGVSPEVAEGQSGFDNDGEVIIGRQQPTPAGQQQTPSATVTTSRAAPALPPALTPGQTVSAIVVTPAPQEDGAPNLQPGTSLLLNVLPKDAPQKAAGNYPLSQLTPDTNTPAAPQQHSSAKALSSLLPDARTVVQTPPSAAAPATTASPAQPATAPQVPPQPQTAQTAIPTPPINLNTPQETTSSIIGQTAPYTVSNQQAATAKFTGPLGQTVVATAIAQGDDGSILFDSPLGSLRVANVGNVPQGQQLVLRVSSVANPNNYTIAVANQAAPEPLTPLPQLSRTWPSMAQIAQLLGEDTASQIIPNFTAGAGIASEAAGRITQAGSQILFFIAALKGGNFRDWIGSQHVRALEEKGYGPLLRKAEGEFMQIARQFAEVLPNNWQSAYFPVIANGELQQVRAFIKREKKKDENGKATGEEDTRFVVEMELSQLGEMQMDGLVKRRETTLQFDLVIRSLHILPADLQRDIQQIYSDTAEITSYRGQLAFQAVSIFPVHPLEDITNAQDDVIV